METRSSKEEQDPETDRASQSTAGIRGTSRMADRVRQFPWQDTDLGPLESWSPVRLATVNIILSSPIPMQLLWGPESIVLYNDAFSEQLGTMEPVALGRPGKIVWKHAWPLVEKQLAATLESGATTDVKSAHVPIERDGAIQESFWDFSYSPVFESDGHIAGVLNISREVTQEVYAKRDLDREQRRSDRILDSIGDAVVVTDANAVVTRMNGVAEALTGWVAHEAVGQPLSNVFNIVHAETRQVMESPVHKVLRLGTIVGLANHTILIRRDGRDVHIEDSGAPIKDDEGRFQGIVLVFRDVTAQRSSEALVEEARANVFRSESDLKVIIDALPAYVSYLDRDFRYVRANRAYEELLGRSTAEIVGKTIDEVLSKAAADRLREPLRKAFAGERQSFSYTTTENGATRILSVSHIPDVDENGSVRGVVIEAHDITSQKRIEETLKLSEDRFRSLIERSSVGLAIGNTRGNLTYLNPALLRLLGYTADEVEQGKVRWDDLTPQQYADVDQKAILQLQSDGVAIPYEKAYVAKDGTVVPLLIGASLMPGAGASLEPDVAVFATDLTMQKRAEEVLIQTEKLAAVGKLASSISHEINNPLEAVTNLLYIALMDESLSQLTRDTLLSADRELARVAHVTAQTLRFHRQSTSPTNVQPEALVEEVLRIFGTRLLNSHIEVKQEFGDAVRVLCYEGEIRQVFANLIGNAVDAMKKGGVLTIRSRFATRWSTGKPGVLVSVADTGSGISPTTRSHIFDAFYTTKGISGTGLGLWISCRIVHKHGGFIRVYSSQNRSHRGTVFMMWLPLQLSETAGESWQTNIAGS